MRNPALSPAPGGWPGFSSRILCAHRIRVVDGIIVAVVKEIVIAGVEELRVFAHESAKSGVVSSRSVLIDPRACIFSAGSRRWYHFADDFRPRRKTSARETPLAIPLDYGTACVNKVGDVTLVIRVIIERPGSIYAHRNRYQYLIGLLPYRFVAGCVDHWTWIPNSAFPIVDIIAQQNYCGDPLLIESVSLSTPWETLYRTLTIFSALFEGSNGSASTSARISNIGAFNWTLFTLLAL